MSSFQEIQKICKHHGLTYFRYNQKIKSRPSFTCKICDNIRLKKLRISKKIKAVDYKGGCCSVCGYNKCINALEFHHIDPSLKEGTINELRNWSWDKIKSEVDKCILVCSNCHRELHSEN